MKTKLVYWDDNLYVKIPKDYLEQLNWKKDEILNIDLDFEYSKIEIFKKEEDQDDLMDREADEDF